MARLVPKRGRSYLSAGHVIPARSQFLLRSDGVECPLIEEKLAGPWKYEKGKRSASRSINAGQSPRLLIVHPRNSRTLLRFFANSGPSHAVKVNAESSEGPACPTGEGTGSIAQLPCEPLKSTDYSRPGNREPGWLAPDPGFGHRAGKTLFDRGPTGELYEIRRVRHCPG